MAFWREKNSFWAILEVCGLISRFPSAVELKYISKEQLTAYIMVMGSGYGVAYIMMLRVWLA